jgi:hypothetical protein
MRFEIKHGDKMVSRRSLMLAVCGLLSATSAFTEEAQKLDILDLKSLVRDLEAQQDHQLTLGKHIPPPDDPVWEDAYKYLKAAPTAVTPYQVAE